MKKILLLIILCFSIFLPNSTFALASDYEDVVNSRNERLDKERAEQERLTAERNFDKESKKASKRLKK